MPAATGRRRAVDRLLPGAVDELAGWLAANHVEQPAVIGHSMGGLMAMMLATGPSRRGGALMVVDALPFYGDAVRARSRRPTAVRPMVEQMRAGLVSGAVPMEAPPHMSNNDAGKAKIARLAQGVGPKIVGEALVEDATTDSAPTCRRSSEPVTVLYAVPTRTASR